MITKMIGFCCLLLSYSLWATAPGLSVIPSDAPNYLQCGKKPGRLTSFISDAGKMYEKCINDVYETYNKRVQEELNLLQTYQNKLRANIKKTAFKDSYAITDCGKPDRGENYKKCNEYLRTYHLILDRIRYLSGWNDNFGEKKKAKDDITVRPYECPSEEVLEQMRAARVFDGKIYDKWMNCKT